MKKRNLVDRVRRLHRAVLTASLVVNWRRGEASTVFEPEGHRMTLDFGKIHLVPGTGGNGQGMGERK